MEVSRCYIDFEILREFSNYCYTWFHLSAFVAFFPIILFYTVIVVTTEVLLFIAKVINKYNNRKSDQLTKNSYKKSSIYYKFK